MEEDIKILEEVLKISKTINYAMETKDLKALENLIKRYRELKEITNTYDAFANDYIPNDVKMVIADRKFFQDGIFNESFIPKSKIKEKIEELEEEKLCFYSDYAIEERNNKIQVLQELMEEK